MNTKIVSAIELKELLKQVKGATFVSFLAHTTPNKVHPELVKSTYINGVINFSYANSVNKALVKEDKEPNFKPQHKRVWGNRVNTVGGYLCSLIEHKNKNYLEVKVNRTIDQAFLYYGKKVAKEKIGGLLPKIKVPNQGLENPVYVRDYNLDNIRMIKFGGNTYHVV